MQCSRTENVLDGRNLVRMRLFRLAIKIELGLVLLDFKMNHSAKVKVLDRLSR